MGRNRGSDSRACEAKIGLCVKGKGGVRMCEDDCRKRDATEAQSPRHLAREPKKEVKRSGAPVGFGGKGAENDPESRRSLPPFTGTETYAES